MDVHCALICVFYIISILESRVTVSLSNLLLQPYQSQHHPYNSLLPHQALNSIRKDRSHASSQPWSNRPLMTNRYERRSMGNRRMAWRSAHSDGQAHPMMSDHGETSLQFNNGSAEPRKRWWLDTIAKLLHSHPLSSDQADHVPSVPYQGAGVRPKWSVNGIDQVPQFHGGQSKSSVIGWPRRQRMSDPYEQFRNSEDELNERLLKYRRWMSPKQWKQFFSESVSGKSNRLFNLALFEAAVVGVRRAVAECRYQFRNERWNCSQVPNEENMLFGNILLRGIPQTAFVYSIINAGIVQSVAEACLGRIHNCPCNNRGRESSDVHWQWQGCDHNIHYGRRFSRRLLDTMEKGPHIRFRMNLHNNRVGRQLVKKNMERFCRCHGTSGSCSLRTCYRRTPRMRAIGNMLKEMFDGRSIRIPPSSKKFNELTENKQIRAENSGSVRSKGRLAQRSMHREEQVFRFPALSQVNPFYNHMKTRDQFPWYSKHNYDEKNLTKPTKNNLVYYEPVPEGMFCEADSELHLPGTHGRECNSTSSGPDNCNRLCCGRGFRIHHYYVMEACHCKFIWCCRVECKQCMVLKIKETCL